MKHILTTALIGALFGLSSCDKPEVAENGEPPVQEQAKETAPKISRHEELAHQVMDAMADLNTAIGEVTDTETAKASAEKIKEIGDRFATITEELNTMERPELKLRMKISQKMQEREEMNESMSEKYKDTLNSLDQEGQVALSKAMMGFTIKMMDATEVFMEHFSAP